MDQWALTISGNLFRQSTKPTPDSPDRKDSAKPARAGRPILTSNAHQQHGKKESLQIHHFNFAIFYFRFLSLTRGGGDEEGYR